MSELQFSILVPVYNVAPYLRECLDSVLGQSYPNFELLLVDDGSTDESGAICDEYAARYPENILVIHKENGGVSSARNAGLEFIQGRYVNFMDADDKLTANTLSLVYVFFEAHREETDVVSIPIIFFEGKTGEHILNYKYNQGARVIDLESEWECIQLSSSSAFIKQEAMAGLAFDTRVKYTEDAKLIQRVLYQKRTLGVISNAHYFYRRRNQGGSAIQSSANDPNWYNPRLKYVFDDTFEFYRNNMGCIPKFIQFAVMYDFQWYLLAPTTPHGVLSTDEETEFLRGLRALLQNIDDEIIFAQHHIKIEHKLYALSLKHGSVPELRSAADDIALCFDSKPAYFISKRSPVIEFLSFDNGFCTVEGFISLFPLPGAEWTIVSKLGCTQLSVETEIESRSIFSLGSEILQFHRFRIRLSLASLRGEQQLRLGVTTNGNTVWFSAYRYGPFSGLTEKYRHAYYLRDGWCVRSNHGVVFSRAKPGERFVREAKYLFNLMFSRQNPARRAVLNRLVYRILHLFKRRPLWLISDRETHAGDNGEALFRYLIANHPEIDARFALLKDSPDYPSLAHTGKVVPADSLKRKILYLVSDYVISSHAEWLDYRPFAPEDAPYRDIMADKRFVFLQHGVIKDDLSHWLRKSSKNIAGFVTSAYPEYESIVHGNYGYTEREVWLTGLPRFDRLISHEDSRQITIMPTWRKYLMGPPDEKTLMRELVPDFTSSRFFTFYNALLNDDRLLRAADEYGYTLAFFPHPNLQPHISIFHKNDSVLFLGADTAYRDVYASSALVVTDYSSAVFDFAYMRRPVIYAHFDREEFFGGGHVYTEGYFDYERDGFGEVEHDLDGTVERIIEYMANGCQMKDEYRARADRFFAFNDRNNCQRVYDKLMENR